MRRKRPCNIEKIQFCCLDMETAIQDNSNSPLTYTPYLRSYIISVPNSLLKKNEIWVGYKVKHCPFCGTKLPSSLAQKRLEILEEEYGVDDPYYPEQKNLIPREFMTDEWWKKREL